MSSTGPFPFLSPEESATFLRHVERFPRQQCPVCAAKEWIALGAHTMLGFCGQGTDGAELAGVSFTGVCPVIMIACTTCGYVRCFVRNHVLGRTDLAAAVDRRPGPRGVA